MQLDPHDLLNSHNACCNRLWNEMMAIKPNSEERKIAVKRYLSENRKRAEVKRFIRHLKNNPVTV